MWQSGLSELEHSVSLTEDIVINSKLKKLFQAEVATLVIFNYPQGEKKKLAVEFEHEVLKYRDMNLLARWGISVCQTC